ncbi:hypothetical protein LPJ57_001815 [Coemansia sp. RSA 486]|nr:hypothetical protein LPJ57_001815 [Coemansia sp. RSA 486]
MNISTHAVRISYSDQSADRICAGSLITDSHIVTAAHCVVNADNAAKKPEELVIGYGNVDSSKQIKASPVSITLHPDYVQNGSPNYSNDIAIVAINPLSLSETVNRIPIYDKAVDPEQVMFTTGWGITEPSGQIGSVLRGVAVVAGSKDQCVNGNKDFVSNAGPFICIPGGLTPGRSSCSSDGGGSVLVSNGGATMLAGFNNIVVSSNSKSSCGSADATRFAINVAYFMDFIVSATGKQKQYFTSTDGVDSNQNALPTPSLAPSADPNITTTVTSVTVVTRTV